MEWSRGQRGARPKNRGMTERGGRRRAGGGRRRGRRRRSWSDKVFLKSKGRGRLEKKYPTQYSSFLYGSGSGEGREGDGNGGKREERRTEKVITEAAFPIHIGHARLYCPTPRADVHFVCVHVHQSHLTNGKMTK